MIIPNTWDWMEEMPGEDNRESFSIEDVLSKEDKERLDNAIREKHDEQQEKSVNKLPEDESDS